MIAVVLESVLLRKHNVLRKNFTDSEDRSVGNTDVTQLISNKQGTRSHFWSFSNCQADFKMSASVVQNPPFPPPEGTRSDNNCKVSVK